jgi:hypothetical protein
MSSLGLLPMHRGVPKVEVVVLTADAPFVLYYCYRFGKYLVILRGVLGHLHLMEAVLVRVTLHVRVHGVGPFGVHVFHS